MKKTKKHIISLLIALVMTVSVFGPTALAANTTDTNWSVDTNFLFFTNNSEVRVKQNSSPVYFYWKYTTGTDNTVKVRILGGTNSSNATTKCTCIKGGTSVDHVICSRGIKYSIHNLAYESSKPYVRFALKNGDITATLSGVWSPDSSKTYTHAVD
jgi:hypothetical protein